MYMNKPNWQEFDFRVASDLSKGTPEYYRELLRNMLGIPSNLPGEKNAISTKQHIKNDYYQTPDGRNMSG